jgi:predicted Zn-dependent protease
MILLLAITLVGFGLDDLGDITGITGDEDVQTVLSVADAFRDAARRISDSEEYYIGRAVAANILETWQPCGGLEFNTYINSVGGWVAMNSPKPCTYGGWHFQLLNSSQINAMACPGGTIFLSRGLLDLCHDEDELACVQAHEVAHVCLQHGLGTVSRARWTEAFATAGMAGAEQWGSADVQEAAQSYGDVSSDILESLVTRGYSREAERSADSLAVVIAAAAGYDPGGLARVLDRMADVTQRSGPGFWQTHPDPEDRLDDLEDVAAGQTAGYAARVSRFTAALQDASVMPARYESQPASGGQSGTSGRGSSGSSGGSSGSSGSGRGR